MGRMEDALRKAAEERERKRLGEGAGTPQAGSTEESPVADSAAPARPTGEPNTAARAAGRAAVPARVSVTPDERLVVFNAPSDERSEQFRKIRANLMALRPVPRVLMVTSGAPSEGKSLAAANLALTFLEIEAGEVLLVDANLRYPEVARLLATRPGPGLSEVLTGA